MMKNHILVCLLSFCTYANAFANDMSNEFTDDYIKQSQGVSIDSGIIENIGISEKTDYFVGLKYRADLLRYGVGVRTSSDQVEHTDVDVEAMVDYRFYQNDFFSLLGGVGISDLSPFVAYTLQFPLSKRMNIESGYRFSDIGGLNSNEFFLSIDIRLGDNNTSPRGEVTHRKVNLNPGIKLEAELEPEPESNLKPVSGLIKPQPTTKLAPLNISFDFDSSVVKPSMTAGLQVMAEHLLSTPSATLRITSYSSNEGSSSYNMWLSKRRAVALKKRLIEQYHVNELQIIAQGGGESDFGRVSRLVVLDSQ